MRKPPGFTRRRIAAIEALVRTRDDGAWVVLLSPPDIKVDNVHRDRRPHMHPGGWTDPATWPLREGIGPDDVVDAAAACLAERGRLAPADLRRRLA
jgi:hypothetical protein